MASQRDLDHMVRLKALQVAQQYGKYICTALCIFFIARYGFLSVKELAGRSTSTTLIAQFLWALHAPRAIAIALAYLLAGGGVTYGYRQGRRAKNVIARFHPEKRAKQLKVDPNKLSSGVTLRGETGPED